MSVAHRGVVPSSSAYYDLWFPSHHNCFYIIKTMHITDIKIMLTYSAVFVRWFTTSTDFLLFTLHWIHLRVKKTTSTFFEYFLQDLVQPWFLDQTIVATRSHDIDWIYSVTPRTQYHLCVQMYLPKNICIQKFKLLPFIRDNSRDEHPTFFSTDPDPAQLIKNSGSGSDLKSKWRKKYILF